jgi:hypothetical protein
LGTILERAVGGDRANHVLRDLGIVFQLDAVLVEKRPSDLADARPTIAFEESSITGW